MNAQTTIHDGGALRASLVFAVVILLGMGLSYSLAGTGLGRLLFAQQATGSMIEREGRIVGSALVAQDFADPRYFRSRPSAAGYDPMAVAGSNQARSNPELRARIAEATAAVARREGIAPSAVPADLVTQSGGGLDPHISPRGAQVQAARVAKARGVDVAQVERMIVQHTEGPQLGLLGQPRVNVLELNLALDAL
ncbi:potassium-transporting ATPase subunit KdpC [Pseudoxanthomonas wuyuanensis]|uniref:Potassium-transporting ATPase KdpC subunit n=1 Tax=Pseudoxanthomonas wuyuanensis TaxID=1073196 RepID=A0A286D6J0_9GAMM|nr:potassium-transporting ATPase subunit KdpC [Pseudoxanthomonas wuyuanensis]KAF1721467.1 potassium-transporting ATPase subunit KdpC [Pseudoxanthomonas wuyuanensis]SOD54275.1 K+-transporting ATPase ATPase C chain [Pseudoxanthomonas wuyuanensis]